MHENLCPSQQHSAIENDAVLLADVLRAYALISVSFGRWKIAEEALDASQSLQLQRQVLSVRSCCMIAPQLWLRKVAM